MKAAILCPGKSLAETMPKRWVWAKKPRYDLVVGVTDAIFANAPFDVWSNREGPAHKHQWRYLHWGQRVLFLDVSIWVNTGVRERWHYLWGISWDNLIGGNFDEMSSDLGWEEKAWRAMRVNYKKYLYGSSFFCALLGAAHKGATEIDVYGADMQGYTNYDPRDGQLVIPEGSLVNPDRWVQRWKAEEKLWDQFKTQFGKNGISMRRISGTSSQVARAAAKSRKRISTPDPLWLSTERSMSESDFQFTSGLAGTSRKKSLPTQAGTGSSSTTPSSSGSDQTASRSLLGRLSEKAISPIGKEGLTQESASDA